MIYPYWTSPEKKIRRLICRVIGHAPSRPDDTGHFNFCPRCLTHWWNGHAHSDLMGDQ